MRNEYTIWMFVLNKKWVFLIEIKCICTKEIRTATMYFFAKIKPKGQLKLIKNHLVSYQEQIIQS